MDEHAFGSAAQLAVEIRDRRVGCLELLDLYLTRAARHNPSLNAIVVWKVDQARERARAADAALARGERWGPLHGIPMTVKESFNVANLPTTFGSPICGTALMFEAQDLAYASHRHSLGWHRFPRPSWS